MIVFFFSISLIILISVVYLINPRKYPKQFSISLLILSLLGLGSYFKFGEHHLINIMETLYEDIKNEQINDPRKLVIFLETKLAKDPHDLEGWLILARTCLITGHIQKAELYYSKARKYFPNNSDVLFETAMLKNNIGQVEKSINLLIEAHDLDNKSLKIKEQLIKTYIKLEKKVDAKLLLEEIKKNHSEYKAKDLRRIENLFERD